MFSGETRLHFEGVLDKHGKRFFEVGLLMFWKFNIKMYWSVTSCQTKCFSYCKEGYIKLIHWTNFPTLQLWSFMFISEKNRTNNNSLRYNSETKDQRELTLSSIKLGDLMITPSKSLWKIICVWYLILNCLSRTGQFLCSLDILQMASRERHICWSRTSIKRSTETCNEAIISWSFLWPFKDYMAA